MGVNLHTRCSREAHVVLPRRHAAIDRDLIAVSVGTPQFGEGADLAQHLRQKGLPAETGVDAHDQDGVDVLNEILLTGVKTQIILTSGFSEAYLRLAESVARFHDSNDIYLLKKPLRRDELIGKLEELMAMQC